ncbi:MAG: DUF2797 domain-containing protein [Salinivirgaceae bacterium]|nr:DUF2797 domain-containing protein [Salinivirgaceae bacterium]
MKYSGNLIKMNTVYNNPVEYTLNIKGKQICMNELLNQTIQVDYLHEINCIHCGQKTNKSFFQGYCYSCFTLLPQADQSVVNPELNQSHLGISKDMEWARENDLIDHYVYLAFTSDLKVGVTRHTQIPTRWIDQGAEFAIKFAKTPYRQLAGLIEVALKPYLKDKTNWRKMLAGNTHETPDMLSFKNQYAKYLPEELQQYISNENEVFKIEYPIISFPEKVNSINLDKTASFSGTLKGIKGQYLIFDYNSVFNVRKHNGYKIAFITDLE